MHGEHQYGAVAESADNRPARRRAGAGRVAVRGWPTAACLPVLSGLLLAAALVAPFSAAAAQDEDSAKTTEEAIPLDELRLFSEIFELIRSQYLKPPDDREMLLNAIRGMVHSLDPHTTYLDAEDHEEMREDASGEFGGVGIEIFSEDGFIRVVTPIDDTPAHAAGLLPGDLVIRIDGDAVQDMTSEEASDRIRGRPGTPVTLTILREDEDAPRDFTIVRDVIEVASVKSELMEPGFARIRITHFREQTGVRLVEALRRAEKENGAPLSGIVLDLRNNPGGVLTSAVSVADAFLDDGLIVYTEGRTPGSREEFFARPSDLLDAAPIVVLLNEGSASAAEIVAGALQDRKRAVIVGSRSFGKGSVQTIYSLEDGSALKLTTAQHYTPLGHSIQARGIIPDIELPKVRFAENEEEDGFVMREGDYPRHLKNPVGEKAPTKKRDAGTLAREDFPMFQALSLLKGLALRHRGA